MFGLAIAFGAVVGFALGLTGGGGGVFAVPLLVYGLGVDPRQAVGISLASVGGTALFGAVPRLLRGDVEIKTALVFAIAGMCGTPLGAYLATWVSESNLLLLFALLMLVVAINMWLKANPKSRRPLEIQSSETPTQSRLAVRSRFCQRDDEGRLQMTTRCIALLSALGFASGILSGMFGVGGGFVIVPALVLFSGMAIHQAVGTSLFVIVLVSISGVISHLSQGQSLSLTTTGLFLLGGCAGMFLGGLLAKRLKGPTLQKVFAIAVVLVAVFIVFRSTLTA